MNDVRLKTIKPGDRIGKLLYRRKFPRVVDGATSRDEGVEVVCDCGAVIEWTRSELNRRRRRWASKLLTAQCGTCEANQAREPTLGTRKSRIAEPGTEQFLRGVWYRLQHERLAQDRVRESETLGRRIADFCDPLMFHIDYRWTGTEPANGDPFENFAMDMGAPPEGRKYLLRRDTFAPFTKRNCYWGDATMRRTNRYSNIDAMRAAGVPTVMIDTLGEAPYSIVQGSRYDPFTNPQNGRVICSPESAEPRHLRGVRYVPPSSFDWFELNNACDKCGINADRGLSPKRKPAPDPAKFGFPVDPEDRQPGESEAAWAARLGLET